MFNAQMRRHQRLQQQRNEDFGVLLVVRVQSATLTSTHLQSAWIYLRDVEHELETDSIPAFLVPQPLPGFTAKRTNIWIPAILRVRSIISRTGGLAYRGGLLNHNDSCAIDPDFGQPRDEHLAFGVFWCIRREQVGQHPISLRTDHRRNDLQPRQSPCNLA